MQCHVLKAKVPSGHHQLEQPYGTVVKLQVVQRKIAIYGAVTLKNSQLLQIVVQKLLFMICVMNVVQGAVMVE